MKLTWNKRRLDLEHPWTLARGTSKFKEYWFVELEEDGLVGHGEAAHNERYGESLESVEACFRRGGEVGPAAALAAIDIAKHDLAGKRRGVRVGELFGIGRCESLPTSYSIGIDSAEDVRSKVSQADEFRILKIKLGGEDDKAAMAAVREVTDKRVWVDANEGWQTREQALERIEWLAGLGVELVEQPLPAGRLDDMAWLKERSPLVLVADEDASGQADLRALVDGFHGINVKLMKAGGIAPAHSMIEEAKGLDLKVMLGCMIESSLGISAALHLAPLADWIDLDGHLLIDNDPYEGISVCDGCLSLADRPGLGVTMR